MTPTNFSFVSLERTIRQTVHVDLINFKVRLKNTDVYQNVHFFYDHYMKYYLENMIYLLLKCGFSEVNPP